LFAAVVYFRRRRLVAKICRANTDIKNAVVNRAARGRKVYAAALRAKFVPLAIWRLDDGNAPGGQGTKWA